MSKKEFLKTWLELIKPFGQILLLFIAFVSILIILPIIGEMFGDLGIIITMVLVIIIGTFVFTIQIRGGIK